jgi:hypothetical protein
LRIDDVLAVLIFRLHVHRNGSVDGEPVAGELDLLDEVE